MGRIGRASFLVKPTSDPSSATMKIFKDIFSGDEMFSDTYKITEVKGVVYEVVGKWETRKSDDIQLEGANASAEEADEGTESTSQTGIDIVLNHRLTKTSCSLLANQWTP